MSVTLAPRINTIAIRLALVAFCESHASLAPFRTAETDLPTGRTIVTPDPAGGADLYTAAWKKNLRVVDGARMAAWSAQECPILIWDFHHGTPQELPSQRHKQRVQIPVTGMIACLGSDSLDADFRCCQVGDTVRDMFLGQGAYIGTNQNEHHILDTMVVDMSLPIPRGNSLLSYQFIELRITAGER